MVPILAMGISYGRIGSVLWGKSKMRENGGGGGGLQQQHHLSNIVRTGGGQGAGGGQGQGGNGSVAGDHDLASERKLSSKRKVRRTLITAKPDLQDPIERKKRFPVFSPLSPSISM